MTRVLVVDDEPSILRALRINLSAREYDVSTAVDGTTGLAAVARDRPDVIILDLGLPDMDGTEVIHGVRGWTSIPIIVLSAWGQESQKVAALDAGADDYVTKPFRLAELLARVRALLRRGAPEVGHGIRGVRIDIESHRAWMGDSELQLTAKEFDLLRVLIRDAGRVVTRDQLMREVWDTTWWTSTKTLDMHISWLRKKLGDDATNPRYITTVRGVGFRFERE